ncbi:KPN_02809 family neutral zinc metallopeptidase [Sphingomonas humi]|uniref:Neutral zinc metallopeptidase n=1 Tax=Sphingomonas humi TaxID=335630 RepID=A0ABP7RY34_9SPHN
MRLDGPGSSNFEDRTGQSGGGSILGGGGGLLGMLVPFVLSRFGIVGLLILALGYCALSGLGGGGILGGGGGSPTVQQGDKEAASRLPQQTQQFLTQVLGSTEQVWGKLFSAAGQQYQPTTLVAYRGGTSTGCGAGQAAMGPFYCPNDKRVYIDPDFFNELSKRFGAPGDFAQAYVIAHEVGHHVQDLEGTLDKASRAQASVGGAQGNAIQVGVELQADCYAGVWAKNAVRSDGTAVLEQGDLEEGLTAAQAIGDDTLQSGAGQAVRPESFTHGTSAQRVEALRRGYSTGNPASCNYNRV